jgi:hypothetical protein
MRLSYHKGKWVASPADAGRGDEMGKENRPTAGNWAQRAKGNIEKRF